MAKRMNIESLHHHLATVVMGWTPGETEFQWNDKQGNRMLDGILFDPGNNISQAMSLLDQFEKWQIRKNPIKKGVWSVMINGGPNHVGNHLENTISLACAVETGYE